MAGKKTKKQAAMPTSGLPENAHIAGAGKFFSRRLGGDPGKGVFPVNIVPLHQPGDPAFYGGIYCDG